MAEIVGYLGVDVGTQGARAVVLDAAGRALGAGSEPMPGGLRSGRIHEQRPDDWWTAVTGSVRAALQAAGPAVRVAAAALAATSGTVLVEAADGTAHGPALMYDDARAQSQAAEAQRIGEPLWRALGYRMQPSWALPKVMWLLGQGDALRTGDRVVHQSDHLVRRLTGTPVATDTSNALKTGVDLWTGRWPMDLLAALGVPTAVLPEVVSPGTVLGVVGAEGAAATGLAAGTPVRAGMTDGCAGQIATRALRAGSWSSTLGTTLVVKGSTPELVRDPAGAIYCHRHPDGGWLPGGASSTGAGVLRQAFPAASGADLDALSAAAAELGPPAEVTYPLAGHGERFPFVAADAHGFGPTEVAYPPARFSALCHGVAYVERLAYDVLGVLGADASGSVALSGGATRNRWWNQLRTDVLGRPTLRPESAEAATGMAVLAAAPPGGLTDTAEAMVRIAEEYKPDPERGERLRPGYERLVTALVERGWLDADLAARAVSRREVRL